jgi:hypothetical protein
MITVIAVCTFILIRIQTHIALYYNKDCRDNSIRPGASFADYIASGFTRIKISHFQHFNIAGNTKL